MRPQQHGRNRRNRGNNSNNNRRNQNPLSRSYESNGPDVKIRGNAQQVADKYEALARDALSSGDRVIAENYLQHAEHYKRIIMAAQAQNARDDENRERRANQDDDEQAATAEGNGEAVDAEGAPQPVIEQTQDGVRMDEQAADQQAEKKPARARRKRKADDETEQTANGADHGELNGTSIDGEGEQPEVKTRTRRPRKKAAEDEGAETVEAQAPMANGAEDEQPVLDA